MSICRYIDDIFFTSNESLKKINQILDKVNNFYSNIKLTCKIVTSLSFLEVFFENKNGVLVTYVYCKEAAETYIVPFPSDHSRHVFANIIDGILMRAISYSSTVSIFNEDRRSIRLMLLYNGIAFIISICLIYPIFICCLQLSTTIHL